MNLLYFGFAWLLSSCHCYITVESEPCQLHNQQNESSNLFMGNSSLNHVTSVRANITLSCQFVNYCFITWHHNGEMIVEGGKYELLNENQELNIQNVTMADAGTYTCTAFNGTHNMSLQGDVTLSGPSEFFNSVSLCYTTQVGSAFTLECTADEFDTIRWYHNGSEITASSNHVFLENNQYMKVQKPSVRDEGEYMCIASLGSQNFSRKGFVKISLCDTSEIVLKGCEPGLVIEAELGSNVSVTCTFDIGAGHLLSTSQWYTANATSGSFMFVENVNFNGAIVATDRGQQGNRDKTCRNRVFKLLILNFSNVTEEVYGTYYGVVKKAQAVEFANVTIEPVEGRSLMIRISAVSGVVVFLTASFFLFFAIWKKFHLDIKLFYRHNLGGLRVQKHAEQDGKLYDTYIACSGNDKDISFVINVLMPALSEKGYSVCFREIDFEPGAGIHEEMWRCMKSSRSCVLLLTPDFFQENLGLSELQVATDTFSNQTNCIIPILREDVQELNVKANPVLKYLVANNSALTLKKDCFTSKKKLVSSAAFKSTRLALPHPSERTQGFFGQRKKPTLVEEEEVQPSKDSIRLPVTSFSATVNNNLEMVPV